MGMMYHIVKIKHVELLKDVLKVYIILIGQCDGLMGDDWHCQCEAGYTGNRCEINDCTPDYCYNQRIYINKKVHAV